MKEKRKGFIINTVQKENKITNASLLHRWILERQGDRRGGNIVGHSHLIEEEGFANRADFSILSS